MGSTGRFRFSASLQNKSIGLVLFRYHAAEFRMRIFAVYSGSDVVSLPGYVTLVQSFDDAFDIFGSGIKGI
jgi:hypothetical protein